MLVTTSYAGLCSVQLDLCRGTRVLVGSLATPPTISFQQLPQVTTITERTSPHQALARYQLPACRRRSLLYRVSCQNKRWRNLHHCRYWACVLIKHLWRPTSKLTALTPPAPRTRINISWFVSRTLTNLPVNPLVRHNPSLNLLWSFNSVTSLRLAFLTIQHIYTRQFSSSFARTEARLKLEASMASRPYWPHLAVLLSRMLLPFLPARFLPTELPHLVHII